MVFSLFLKVNDFYCRPSASIDGLWPLNGLTARKSHFSLTFLHLGLSTLVQKSCGEIIRPCACRVGPTGYTESGSSTAKLGRSSMARADNTKCFHVLSAVALLLYTCSAVKEQDFVYPVGPSLIVCGAQIHPESCAGACPFVHYKPRG